MVSHYRNGGGGRGQSPTTLLRLAAIVLAMASIAGSASAWSWDARAVRIVQPIANNVDSGTVVTPSAVVRNLGDSIASFPVLFSITPDYVDTVQVESLASGDSLTLTFADWTALQRGSTTAACSTALAADESTANDRVSRTFNVRVRDLGVDSIVVPVGTVYFGVPIAPQATVTNHGTGTANNFSVSMRIGASYSSFSMQTNLAAGASRTVSFANWAPDSLGTIAVACTVALNFDAVPGNNLVQDSCTVVALAKDAGVMRIAGPRGIVDSGAVFTPQAMLRNYGTDAASFPAIFRIGATYADTQQVTGLAPFDSVLVNFADWSPDQVGTFATRCTVALADDSNPANDARSDSVIVIVRNNDVGAVRFTAPPDTVDSGAVVPVKAWVRNFGLLMQSFPVMARIGTTFYADTVQVDSLAAGDSLEVTFADYTVPFRGSITARCSTLLTGDQVVANNRALKTIFRRVRDVRAASITAPTGTVAKDTVVVPSARLLNIGNTTDSFPVIFRIGTLYEDTVRTNDSVVTFRPCTLSTVGTFATMCSTAMVGDVTPANDAVFDSVQVTGSGITASDGPGLPRTVTLTSRGPFAGRVAIEYGLPRSAVVRLDVYDACGRSVRVLASGPSAAGYHTAVWKCSDDHGRAIAQGAYFVRLVADDVTLTGKVVKTE
jgi:hypothetical protein